MGKSGFHFAALVKSDQRLGCSLAARAQHGSGRGRDCVQWHKERGLGGKSRSCRSGHSRAFARNFASPCLRGGVVDFAIFDQGKQDSCSQ